MPALGVLAIGALTASGCGSAPCSAGSSSALVAEGGTDGGGDATAAADAQGGGEGVVTSAPSTTPTLAGVRLANWSADSPPVDFCLAPHGTTDFQGPLLQPYEADGGACDGGAGVGLAFPEVSTYLLLEPRQYDARVVVGGASDCSVKLADDNRGLPVLTPGAWMTLALLGEANPVGGASGLETMAYLDTGIASGSGVALRFINAAANVATVGLETEPAANSFVPVVSNVPFGQAGTIDGQEADAATATTDTYVTISPPSGETFFASTSLGSSDVVTTANGVTIAAGAVVTLTLVGPVSSSDGGSRAQLLECVDNAGTVCVTGDCQIISP